MCVVIPFILDVRLVDVPAGVTQEEGHTGIIHLPSAVLALTFLARRIQPFISLVDREVEFCRNFVYKQINRSPLVGHFYFWGNDTTWCTLVILRHNRVLLFIQLE